VPAASSNAADSVCCVCACCTCWHPPAHVLQLYVTSWHHKHDGWTWAARSSWAHSAHIAAAPHGGAAQGCCQNTEWASVRRAAVCLTAPSDPCPDGLAPDALRASHCVQMHALHASPEASWQLRGGRITPHSPHQQQLRVSPGTALQQPWHSATAAMVSYMPPPLPLAVVQMRTLSQALRS
jgi:hypothetical protein